MKSEHPKLKIIKVWVLTVVRDGVPSASVFHNESEAEEFCNRWEGYERYVSRERFATVDGVSGVLVRSGVIRIGSKRLT